MHCHSNSLLLTVAVVMLSGCSNAPKQEDRVETTLPAPRAPAAAAQSVAQDTVQETESRKFGRLVKGVEGQSVYFAYDDFTIPSKYQQLIQAHAEVLRKAGRGLVVLEEMPMNGAVESTTLPLAKNAPKPWQPN